MNFVNNSTDQNNSQVVIFQSNATGSELTATATHVVSIPQNQVINIPLPAKTKATIGLSGPGVIKGQQIHTVTLLTPVITAQAGQTVYISGDADTGYFIEAKNE